IALLEKNDLILIDVENRRLDIIGIDGKELDSLEIEAILVKRKENWIKPAPKYTKGALGIYTKLAVSPMKGGYIKL
ncbi:MAG: dihydroxy-acid dehydratase, partial [Cetobacterium sp.]